MSRAAGLAAGWRRLAARSLPRRIEALARHARTRLAARVLLRPFASVVMIHAAWPGALIWLAVARDLRWAVFAALGLLVGEAARRTLRIQGEPETEGSLKANALLTALAVAWVFPAGQLPLPAQLGLLLVATAIAAVLAAAVLRALAATNLPPLVVGYCLVASILFLIFPDWALAAALSVDWGDLPTEPLGWVVLFFRTVGAFYFQPELWPGVIVALAVLLWSRTMFLAGLTGWLAGTLTAMALGQLGVVFYWLPVAYNFFLAGVALGSVYFLPGWAALGSAAFGGCLAAFAAVGLQHLLHFATPAFLPLPFTLTVWIGIGALKPAARRGQLLWNARQTLDPESAWWHAAIEAEKWGRGENLLMVPLGGEAEVTQGFSGRLSHAGRWRHALDFQRPGGKSILGAPVLAPGPGIVERVRNDVPDNPAGVSNYAENWGNHVVIRLDAGGWALLAHLKQGSATVVPGLRVGFGTVLGEVGNSGRSPVPHLHLQVQAGPEPGEATQPFRLANFLHSAEGETALRRWAAAAVPAEGTRVGVAPPNAAVHQLLAGMSPGHALWSVEVEGSVPAGFLPPHGLAGLRVDSELDSAGRQILSVPGAGRLAARYDLDAWRVVEMDGAASPFLRLLALAAPCVPYVAAPGTGWSDIAVTPATPAGPLRRSLLPFLPQPFLGLDCRCTAAPSAKEDRLAVETRPLAEAPGLPRRMVCEMRRIAGPFHLGAAFAEGSVDYRLISFTPDLPRPTDDDQD